MHDPSLLGINTTPFFAAIEDQNFLESDENEFDVNRSVCMFPTVSFMELTRMLAIRAARQALCSHACVLRRASLIWASACRVGSQCGARGSPTVPCARVERSS